VIGCISAATVVASAAFADKAMITPAVAIAPAGPWAHAQEDAAVEVSRPVEAIRRASVGCVVVVAVGTDGLNADADGNLRVRHRRQGQAREQCCS
jgi:hypothetical protein